jgi:hypothetical protein
VKTVCKLTLLIVSSSLRGVGVPGLRDLLSTFARLELIDFAEDQCMYFYGYHDE